MIPPRSLERRLLYRGDSNSSSEASWAIFSFNLFLFRDLDPDMLVLGVKWLLYASAYKENGKDIWSSHIVLLKMEFG